MAALAVYRPRQIGLALGVPLPMWAAFLAYVFIDVAGLPASTNIANEAHLLGMLSGAVIGYHLRDRDLIRRDNEKDDGDSRNQEDDWREKIRSWEEKWMM